MSIGLGAALLSTGTVSDDFGRRRTFAAGLLVLAVGSVAAAVAPGTLVFVLARVVQGVGGAAAVASSLGIIAATYPPGPERAAASGVWGASVGAGIAVGPLMTAGFDRVLSWRDAYWVVGRCRPWWSRWPRSAPSRSPARSTGSRWTCPAWCCSRAA